VLPIAVLAALLVTNLVLLFLLLQPNRAITARPADKSTWAGRTSSPTATPTPSPSTEQTSSASPSALKDPTPSSGPIQSAPAERLIYAVSSTTAWRATVGDCDTPGKVERSTNGGASWELIVGTGPAPIVRIGAEPNGGIFAIGGAGQSCKAHYAAYASDGTVTASINNPMDVWFPRPRDRDEINGPRDTEATPCEGHVVGLAPLDLARALVICDNGAAMSTRDSGSTWQQVAQIPNSLAVAATGGRYWVASGTQDCDGITVRALTVKRRSKSSLGNGYCAPLDNSNAGQVALGVSDDAIWVWAGWRVAVSTDSGRTWK
jgi:hypothetical protein